jgi:hypothetical protein
MARISVSLSVSDDRIDQFPEVVDRAREAGLDVWQELDLIGVVSGSIDEERLEELRRIPGVAAVEPEREFQIPPPDSEIQSVPDEAGTEYEEASSDMDVADSPADNDDEGASPAGQGSPDEGRTISDSS